MHCVYCGKQVPDDNPFCTGCGKPLYKNAQTPAAMRPGSAHSPEGKAAVEAPAQVPDIKELTRNAKPSKLKAALWILLGVFSVALITAAVLIVLRITDPVNRFTTSVEAGKYAAAAKVYKEGIAGNPDREQKAGDYLNGIIQDTTAAFDAKTVSYEDAIGTLDTIGGMHAADSAVLSDARNHIEKLNVSRTSFAEAEKLFAGKDYLDAAEKYRLVIGADENYGTAQKQLDAALDDYRTAALTEAGKLAAARDFEGALKQLSECLGVFPGDSEIMKEIDRVKADRMTYSKEQSIVDIETRMAAGDYAGAFDILDQLLLAFPNDEEVIAAQTNLENAYVADVLAQALAAFGAKKNYQEAVKKIDDALIVLPSNQTLEAYRVAYESYTPVYLSEMTFSDYKGELHIDDFAAMQDNGGTAHTHSLYVWKGYIAYSLNGNYTTLSLTAAVPYDAQEESGYGVLRIYADDREIYNSGKMKSDSAMQPVLLDVTGVQEIKMVWESSSRTNSINPATVWDAYVQR
jgi:tetratricopeptide (TPR) repeat protein